jgi:putative CocE/NonD family hydrolase
VGTDVIVEFGKRITMRDGVYLAADVIRPPVAESVPTIVVPMWMGKESQLADARRFACDGFAVVLVDVRGRGDSDGRFAPDEADGQDLLECVEWSARQPFCSGRVGLRDVDGSHDAWLAALLQPSHLAAMSVRGAPPDAQRQFANELPDIEYLAWLFTRRGRVPKDVHAVPWGQVATHRPLATMDESAGFQSPAWKSVLEHRGQADARTSLRYQDRLTELDVPVLHITGWYHPTASAAIANFQKMAGAARTERARRAQMLIVGAWNHRLNQAPIAREEDFGAAEPRDLLDIESRWFGNILRADDGGIMHEPSVRLFVTGVASWRTEREFPSGRARPCPLYLHSGGRANSALGDGQLLLASASEPAADHFTADLSHPVPYPLDERGLPLRAPFDCRAIERRDDVLVYTTDPLAASAEVTGAVRVTVFLATDVGLTDVVARLVDVHADGCAVHVADGIVRVADGGDETRACAIDLGFVAHVFAVAHCIRLELASAAFPKWNCNQRDALARHTVAHGGPHQSHVALPVIGGALQFRPAEDESGAEGATS